MVAASGWKTLMVCLFALEGHGASLNTSALFFLINTVFVYRVGVVKK